MAMAHVLLTLALLGMLSKKSDGKAALFIVDVQDCFMPYGSLSVPKTDLLLPRINQIIAERSCLFDSIVFFLPGLPHHKSQYLLGFPHGLAEFSHLNEKEGLPMMCINSASGLGDDGACCPTEYIDAPSVDCSTQLCTPAGWSYATNNINIVTGNAACTTCESHPSACFKTTQAMWTDHCDPRWSIQANITTSDPEVVVQLRKNTAGRRKIQFVDAHHSAFADNSKTVKTALDSMLQGKQITELYVLGVATDACVHATVIDGLNSNVTSGYTINVVTDATEAWLADAENQATAEASMKAAGATLLTTAEVLALACPSEAIAGVSSAYKLGVPLLSIAAVMVGLFGVL